MPDPMLFIGRRDLVHAVYDEKAETYLCTQPKRKGDRPLDPRFGVFFLYCETCMAAIKTQLKN